MKKITRRTVLRASGLAAASLALSGCAPAGSACVGNGFSDWLKQTFGKDSAASSESTEAAAPDAGTPDAGAASEPPAESADTSLPAYNADPLTGEPRRSNGRMVGVMVNNISNTQRQNARPQRGIGSADLLIESKVEGGISRFCAVYYDANAIPEVGPLRSGRDQFLQLLMPWQALYYHDGESAPCTKFINVYNYSGLNIGGKSYFNTPTHPHVAHRDSRGRNVAYEHTEFTSGAEIRKAAANAGIGLQYPYESTFFRFADYRTGAENKMSGAAAAKTINIVHSDSYKTTFSYNRWDHLYKMSMYSRAAGAFENTVDEQTSSLALPTCWSALRALQTIPATPAACSRWTMCPAARPISLPGAQCSGAHGRRPPRSTRSRSTLPTAARSASTGARPIWPSWTTTSGKTSTISKGRSP